MKEICLFLSIWILSLRKVPECYNPLVYEQVQSLEFWVVFSFFFILVTPCDSVKSWHHNTAAEYSVVQQIMQICTKYAQYI